MNIKSLNTIQLRIAIYYLPKLDDFTFLWNGWLHYITVHCVRILLAQLKRNHRHYSTKCKRISMAYKRSAHAHTRTHLKEHCWWQHQFLHSLYLHLVWYFAVKFEEKCFSCEQSFWIFHKLDKLLSEIVLYLCCLLGNGGHEIFHSK